MTDPAEAQYEDSSILEWVWGAIQGDFNENPTVGQIITNAAITAIPVVDQVGDARDLVANLKALIWEKRYDEVGVWIALFFTLIGLIPTLGSLLKGVLKLIYYGAKLDDVFRFINSMAKVNAFQWLKELQAGKLREYASKSAEMLKQIMDSIIGKLSEALAYVPRWASDLAGKINELLAELRKIRSMIDSMFARITKDLEEKLNKLLQEQVDNSVEGSSKGALKQQQKAVTKEEYADRIKELEEKNGKSKSGKNASKMQEHKPACFNIGDKLKKKHAGNQGETKKLEAEYDRQLKMQQDGINDMTVKEYLDNRATLKKMKGKYGNEKARQILTDGGKAQQKAREEFEEELHKNIVKDRMKKGIDAEEAEKQAVVEVKKQMEQLAALHNPDMIAGGKDEIGGFGDRGVNSSIGAQWPKNGRVIGMDEAAVTAYKQYGPDTKMNVKLEQCR